MARHDFLQIRTAADARTLAELLRWRAVHQPDRVGYVFLTEEGGPGSAVTYADLDRMARVIALQLQAAGVSPEERALLLYPPGVDFLAAFFGCMYADVVAVPTFPPDPFRLDRTLPRIATTVADASPATTLTVSWLRDSISELSSSAHLPPCIVTDAADQCVGDDWTGSRADDSVVAMLQYTSGSTSRPKGVILSHRNLLHNSRLIQRFFATTTDSRGLVWLPPYHDMGLIGGLLQPLYVGFPVWLMSPLDFLRRPLRWLQAVSQFGATISGGPNFAYDLCVRKTTPQQRAKLDLSSWAVAFNGAEPVRAATMARFAEAFRPAGFEARALLPCYGLAESTLIVSGGSPSSTAGHVDRDALAHGDVVAGAYRLVSAGSGAPDQHIAIVDPVTGSRCSAERVGEIWVRGPSVAGGYWGRGDESREIFGARIHGEGADTFLRTGDLGFVREGELVVTGRLRDLIIIRGRNHYPQDIEVTAEASHAVLRPGGGAAVMIDYEGEPCLAVVHEVVRVAQPIDLATVAAEIRRHVAMQHEVQVGLVVLIESGGLPKTTSGKVQRDECRRLLLDGKLAERGRSAGPSTPGGPSDYAAPQIQTLPASPAMQQRTALEQQLRTLTSQTSGIPESELPRDSPLLASGLDSLSTQMLIQRAEAELGVRLSLAEILSGASLAHVAARACAQIEGRSADLPAEIVPAQASEVVPLDQSMAESDPTPGQRALWFLHQMDPRSAALTLATAFRVTGPLNPPALRRAFEQLVCRHPSLRATYPKRDGAPIRVLRPDSGVDLTADDELDDATFATRLAADVHRPFDLSTGPLVRLHIYRLPAAEHVVLFAAHHIVTDFWSATQLAHELEALYSEQVGGPAARLPAQICDNSAVWERQRLDTPEGRESAQYWERELGNGLVPTRLGSTPADESARRATTLSFRLDDALSHRLRQLAAEEGTTPYAVMLAGYLGLLHRRTGQPDVVVGTPVAARSRKQLTNVVGYLMNPVVLRSQASSELTFRQLLARTKLKIISAIEHQDFPIPLLAEQHPIARAGLFHNLFIYNQPIPADASSFPAVLLGHAGVQRPFGPLQVESLAVEVRECVYDTELSLSDLDGEVRGHLRFRTDVFDQSSAQRFVQQFIMLLESAADCPDARIGSLPPATDTERNQILHEWNDSARAIDTNLSVPFLFERQAKRTPDAPALTAGSDCLSYRQLDEQANRLANRLRDMGVGPRRRVGVCLDRGPDLVVALLAVLKTGAAYVPIDPVNPHERIASTFADANVHLVLTQRDLAGKVGGVGAPVTCLDTQLAEAECDLTVAQVSRARPEDTAYVIYTSGSTGSPKGVEIAHRSLSNYIQDAAELFDIGPHDRVLQFYSVGFDASAEEIYPALVRGGCLVLRTDHMLADPATFLDGCAAREVTVIQIPAGFWHTIVLALDRGTATLPPTLRLIVVTGEAVLPHRVSAWQRLVGADVQLINTYGPTEATITASACDLTAVDVGSGVPIGRPVANVCTYVLDDDLQPAPVGMVGELYIGGAGLARGYVNRHGLSAQRFVANPFDSSGGRLYRTGDRVRYQADGSVVYLGRVDRQLKINGYRIELGEIESVLRRCTGVTDAAVVRSDRSGRLVAYLTSVDGATLDGEELRAALRATLPEYMVPASYIGMATFPHTPSGKLDYAELAAAETPASPTPDQLNDLPGTPQEQALASVWCEVLGVREVHRHDDFFALGGHSLLAAKMLARLESSLGLELPLRAVFESPTLAALATRLRPTPASGSRSIPLAPRDQPLPLSYVQEAIWFLEQLQRGSTNYNVPRALRLHGALDVEAVRRAFDDLEVRHEILRTTFQDIDGEPTQCVGPPCGIPVTVVDQADLSVQERDPWIRDRILASGRQPFDLSRDQLLRVTLVRLAADDHLLIVVEHHLVHDGWAQGVLLRDFLELYESQVNGRRPLLPELPIQYADFAVWQRRSLQGPRLAALLAYWRRRLNGAPSLLQLPTDRPRPKVLTSRGGEETLLIDCELAEKLRHLSQEYDATLYMTMLAGFVALLYERSGQDDILVGAGMANRQRPELENMLGMVINTVVLRTDVSGCPSFVELLARVRESCLGAYDHQDLPFEKLVECLQPTRDLSHTPLFQVMFSFLDTPIPPLRLPGMTLEVLEAHNRSAKFDLNAVVIPQSQHRLGNADADPLEETIAVLMEYNADLFDRATVHDLLDDYFALLQSAVAEPHLSVDELVRLVSHAEPDMPNEWPPVRVT